MDSAPVPAEVIVVMRRYAREPPNAAELFDDPHQQIAGPRILSLWFAAQLIDSALYRGIAACDRLAILLRCVAGLPAEARRGGVPRQPAFTPGDLERLAMSYESSPDWLALRDLTTSPFYWFIKQERNGFTHERRRPSLLHGEHPVVYGSQGTEQEQFVPVRDAQTHYALAPAFYNEILVPAIERTRAVVVRARLRPPEDGGTELGAAPH